MKSSSKLFAVCLGILTTISAPVFGEPKIEEQILGPEGKWLGCALSSKGVHAAVLLTKGSRFAVALDGVEGPKVDQLFTADGQPFFINGGGGAITTIQLIPVLFSDDGAHSAYFAKLGSEYVVVLDGKELVRGPITTTSRFIGLRFSAGGKHVFHVETDAAKGQRAFVDGQPGPWTRSLSEIATSPDGSHYAYTGAEDDAAKTKWAVVDGKKVKYFGRELKFTITGALLSILDGPNGQAQILNGKPVIQAAAIQRVWVSPTGPLVATLVLPKQGALTVLAVNGKPVPGTEGLMIAEMYFSPDGKRWAASCRNGASASFVLIDGKKGQEYQSLMDSGGQIPGAAGTIGFTPDSSKFYYVAQQGGQSFLVVEDEEWDGIAGNIEPSVGGGNRLGFIGAVSATGKKFVVVDNKAKERLQASSLSFSSDGSRYAFVAGISTANFWLDDFEVPGIALGRFIPGQQDLSASPFVFSPDSNHIVTTGYVPSVPGQQGLYLNSKLVWKPEGNTQFKRPVFTPDSQHLFWIAPRRTASNEDKDTVALYVDGKQAIKFAGFNPLDTGPGNWEMSPDGTVTFAAIVGNELKRIRVTPSPDATISTLLATATK